MRVIIGILPAWFRFAQCLRRYRDTREVFPHLVNAGKYSTGFFVAVFSSINAYYEIMYADKYGPGIVRIIFEFKKNNYQRNYYIFFSSRVLVFFSTCG